MIRSNINSAGFSIRIFCVICLCISTSNINAAPWLATDDAYLRDSMDLLSIAGYITKPINAYPLLWRSVLEELNEIDINQLNDAELFAFNRVMAAARFAGKQSIVSLRLGANGGDDFQNYGFGAKPDSKKFLRLKSELKGDNWAMGITRNVTRDSYLNNPEDARWDESYFSYHYSDFVFTVAKQSQWHGPSKELNASFRNSPAAAEFVQVSTFSEQFKHTPVIDMFGAVGGFIQIGQLNIDGVADVLEYSMVRFISRPLPEFEFGVSVVDVKSTTTSSPELIAESARSQVNIEEQFSFDFSLAMGRRTSLYGEFVTQKITPQSISSRSWLIGSSYYLGNSTNNVTLYAEFQDLDDTFFDWNALRVSEQIIPSSTKMALGLRYSHVSGRGAYAKVFRLEGQKQDVWQSQLGFQEPFLSGLISFEYSNNKFNQEQLNDTNVFSVTLEWRW